MCRSSACSPVEARAKPRPHGSAVKPAQGIDNARETVDPEEAPKGPDVRADPTRSPFPYRSRNSKARQRLAPAHDLHHILTGYSKDFLGEAEIGAWEIGSGLRDPTGLWLSFRVLGFVVLLAPRRIFRAYLRGLHNANLFDAVPLEVPLLDRTVSELRRELGILEQPPPASPSDRIAFAGWAAAGIAIVYGPIVPVAALLWWWLG